MLFGCRRLHWVLVEVHRLLQSPRLLRRFSHRSWWRPDLQNYGESPYPPTCYVSRVFCLIVWGFSSYSRIFYSYGDGIITGEGLQSLLGTHVQWAVRVSLAYHTYFYTGHPFIMVISENFEPHTSCRAFCSGAVTTCLTT